MEALRRELIQTKIDLHQTRMALCRQVCDTCQPLRKKNSGSHGNVRKSRHYYNALSRCIYHLQFLLRKV